MERCQCADGHLSLKWCYVHNRTSSTCDTVREAIASERERCARVAETFLVYSDPPMLEPTHRDPLIRNVAKKIREGK